MIMEQVIIQRMYNMNANPPEAYLPAGLSAGYAVTPDKSG
jgi:hypothetical protein